MAKKYRHWGKVWEVLQSPATGSWYGGYRRVGFGDSVLDKIGTADSCDEMQDKLDAWARRNGARPVLPAGCRLAEQMRLF